jgi:hypothetical protein
MRKERKTKMDSHERRGRRQDGLDSDAGVEDKVLRAWRALSAWQRRESARRKTPTPYSEMEEALKRAMGRYGSPD